MIYAYARDTFVRNMMDLTYESSSEDDIYVGSASHLRALRERPPRSADVDGDDDDNYDSSGAQNLSCSASVDDPSCIIPPVRPLPSSIAKRRSGRACRQARKNTPATASTIVSSELVGAETVDLECEVPQDPAVVEDDYCIDVKVMWRSNSLKRFKMRRYEPFERIFKYFAEIESVPPKQVLLMKGERPLSKSDTPASVDLRVIDILEGGIIDASVASNDSSSVRCCRIKIQTSSSTRRKMSLQLEMEETFDRVVSYCAEILEVDPSRIRLTFDGEDIGPSETPESLDLEREACIDLLLRPL